MPCIDNNSKRPLWHSHNHVYQTLYTENIIWLNIPQCNLYCNTLCLCVLFVTFYPFLTAINSYSTLQFSMFVCLFHFFSETTKPIALKIYMGFCNHKAQKVEQDGACRMHNFAKFLHSSLCRSASSWECTLR